MSPPAPRAPSPKRGGNSPQAAARLRAAGGSQGAVGAAPAPRSGPGVRLPADFYDGSAAAPAPGSAPAAPARGPAQGGSSAPRALPADFFDDAEEAKVAAVLKPSGPPQSRTAAPARAAGDLPADFFDSKPSGAAPPTDDKTGVGAKAGANESDWAEFQAFAASIKPAAGSSEGGSDAASDSAREEAAVEAAIEEAEVEQSAYTSRLAALKERRAALKRQRLTGGSSTVPTAGSASGGSRGGGGAGNEEAGDSDDAQGSVALNVSDLTNILRAKRARQHGDVRGEEAGRGQAGGVLDFGLDWRAKSV